MLAGQEMELSFEFIYKDSDKEKGAGKWLSVSH